MGSRERSTTRWENEDFLPETAAKRSNLDTNLNMMTRDKWHVTLLHTRVPVPALNGFAYFLSGFEMISVVVTFTRPGTLSLSVTIGKG